MFKFRYCIAFDERAMPCYLIPFALRTSGFNGSEQGSDSAPIIFIDYTIIDVRDVAKEFAVQHLDVQTLGLKESLEKIERSVPVDSVLVTNGINAVRQVLHPQALRSSLKLTQLYCTFINAARLKSFSYNSTSECTLQQELTAISNAVRVAQKDL
uniref:PIN_6 domain-containing protein n=1 Tax=Syphacia muris TaxID=451379 RepID=A0A158R649_9BILA